MLTWTAATQERNRNPRCLARPQQLPQLQPAQEHLSRFPPLPSPSHPPATSPHHRIPDQRQLRQHLPSKLPAHQQRTRQRADRRRSRIAHPHHRKAPVRRETADRHPGRSPRRPRGAEQQGEIGLRGVEEEGLPGRRGAGDAAQGAQHPAWVSAGC